MNEVIYALALWLDAQQWSTGLHESYYMYSWVETTHVLSLMVSLGLLFIIDLRILGLAFVDIPASTLASRLNLPMLVGFVVMVITGLALFYAIPVRTAQSLWFRIKFLLLAAALVNAVVFHRRMNASVATWSVDATAPTSLRWGAGLSIVFWSLIVICGRLIAYDWLDCAYQPHPIIQDLAGCLPGQKQF